MVKTVTDFKMCKRCKKTFPVAIGVCFAAGVTGMTSYTLPFNFNGSASSFHE